MRKPAWEYDEWESDELDEIEKWYYSKPHHSFYTYTYDELIDFLNDLESHWEHGPPLLKYCRPVCLVPESKFNVYPFAEQVMKELGYLPEDSEKVLEILELLDLNFLPDKPQLEDLPTYWNKLVDRGGYDRMVERYLAELYRTHEDLNRVVDIQTKSERSDREAAEAGIRWVDLLELSDPERHRKLSNLKHRFTRSDERAYLEGRRLLRSALKSEIFELRLPEEFEGFLPPSANLVYVTPDFGNYYLTLSNLLNDVDRSKMNEEAPFIRVYRCDVCDRVILIKRRDQRFCSKKCKSTHHNAQKDPQNHAAYMREWRKKLKLQDARLRRKQAKAKQS